uniref:Uncharacterized protein n=1 Tax=Salvator merianae TaxID=96440 RepID=A0A8D0C6G6_SALMN
MKVLLGLMALLFIVDFCWGACFIAKHEAVIKNGKLAFSKECTDEHDGTKYSIGSVWNTTKCMRCECHENEMECCTRYGGTTKKKDCKTVLDEETCEYKFYRLDDPSKPCN